MSPKLFSKKTRSERLNPTPLTPEKFFNTCSLILEKEALDISDKSQKNILKKIQESFSNFKKQNEIKPATLDDWKNFESDINQYISRFKNPNNDCALRLELLMQTPLQQMKHQALSNNFKP